MSAGAPWDHRIISWSRMHVETMFEITKFDLSLRRKSNLSNSIITVDALCPSLYIASLAFIKNEEDNADNGDRAWVKRENCLWNIVWNVCWVAVDVGSQLVSNFELTLQHFSFPCLCDFVCLQNIIWLLCDFLVWNIYKKNWQNLCAVLVEISNISYN